MKKLLISSVIFFVVTLLAATCALAQCGRQNTAQANHVQVDTSSSWRYGLPGHQMTITNTTSCYAFLSVGVTDKANILPPGGTLSTAARDNSGKKHFWSAGKFVGYDRSSNIEVPIVARFYADAERNNYIGAAVTKITLPGYGMSSSYSLIFRPENIQLADDAQAGDSSTPSDIDPNPQPLFTNIDTCEGCGVWVIVWNSTKPARITVNGTYRGSLPKGAAYYLATRKMVTMSISAEDANGQARFWTGSWPNENYYGVTVWVAGTMGVRNLR